MTIDVAELAHDTTRGILLSQIASVAATIKAAAVKEANKEEDDKKVPLVSGHEEEVTTGKTS
jgi:hypothetical protein